MTYLLLNSLWILPVALAALRWRHVYNRRWLVALLGMLLLTAVFDSAIIAADIVRYHAQNIIGLYIGKAPAEDFYYTIAAALLAPLMWRLYGRKSRS